MNRRLHSWPFRPLRSFVAYKAAMEGIPSDDIDPAGPARRVVYCGGQRKGRIVLKRTVCLQCVRSVANADVNAAVNIRQEISELKSLN